MTWTSSKQENSSSLCENPPMPFIFGGAFEMDLHFFKVLIHTMMTHKTSGGRHGRHGRQKKSSSIIQNVGLKMDPLQLKSNCFNYSHILFKINSLLLI